MTYRQVSSEPNRRVTFAQKIFFSYLLAAAAPAATDLLLRRNRARSRSPTGSNRPSPTPAAKAGTSKVGHTAEAAGSKAILAATRRESKVQAEAGDLRTWESRRGRRGEPPWPRPTAREPAAGDSRSHLVWPLHLLLR